MTDGEFWWRQIPGCARLAARVTREICAHHIVLLHVPEALPWAGTFRRLAEDAVHRTEAARSLDFVAADDIFAWGESASLDDISDALGDYLLTHFCRPDVQDGFRPALGYAGYLAACRDTTLGASYLWLTDVPDAALGEWTTFLTQYGDRFADAKRRRGLPGEAFACLLETTAPDAYAKKGIVELDVADFITSYDGYTFLFFRAGEMQLSGTPAAAAYLRPCLAELARSLGDGDIEWSAALLAEGTRLIEDPIAACRRVAAAGSYSDGRSFPPAPPAETVRRRAWTTQIRLVFPWLEEQRIAFLDRHKAEAARLLAGRDIENGNHEAITDIHLLEIGSIYYYKSRFDLTDRERRAIDLHRAARNDLAHLAPLDLAALTELYANPLA